LEESNNKVNNKIFFIIFMIVWVMVILLNIFLPVNEFSSQENRYLATFPSFSFEKLVSGEYTANLDEYLNDHFSIRNLLIKIDSLKEQLILKTENKEIYIGEDGNLFEKFKYSEENKQNVEYITNKVNELSKQINKDMYFVIIPNSTYINQNDLPKYAHVENQEQIISDTYKKMPNIKTIDVVNKLKANNDEYIFFKTDHHFTSLGAYYVYEEICKEMNIEYPKLNEFNVIKVSSSFLGTYDSKVQIINQQTDDIYVYENDLNTKGIIAEYDGNITNSIYNEKYLQEKDKYSYFLNSNNAKVVIKTANTNGKKLLVIKDSYAHIMAQFLVQNFEEVHLIDPRYYRAPISEYIEKNDIDDVLFLYSISNLSTDLGLRTIK